MSSFVVFLVTIFCAMLPVVELRGAMPIGMSETLWGDGALGLLGSVTASTIGGILACFVVVAMFIPLKKLLARIPFFSRFFDYFDSKATEQLARFSSKFARVRGKFTSIFKRKHRPSTATKTATTSREELPVSYTRAITFPAPPKAKTADIKAKKSRKSKDGTFSKCVLVFLFCAMPLPFTGVWSAGALCGLLGLGFWASVTTLILANLVGSGFVAIFCLIFENYIDLVLLIMAIILLLTILYGVLKLLLSRPKIKDNSTFCD